MHKVCIIWSKFLINSLRSCHIVGTAVLSKLIKTYKKLSYPAWPLTFYFVMISFESFSLSQRIQICCNSRPVNNDSKISAIWIQLSNCFEMRVQKNQLIQDAFSKKIRWLDSKLQKFQSLFNGFRIAADLFSLSLPVAAWSWSPLLLTLVFSRRQTHEILWVLQFIGQFFSNAVRISIVSIHVLDLFPMRNWTVSQRVGK